jgi:hypothetical protein
MWKSLRAATNFPRCTVQFLWDKFSAKLFSVIWLLPDAVRGCCNVHTTLLETYYNQQICFQSLNIYFEIATPTDSIIPISVYGRHFLEIPNTHKNRSSDTQLQPLYSWHCEHLTHTNEPCGIYSTPCKQSNTWPPSPNCKKATVITVNDRIVPSHVNTAHTLPPHAKSLKIRFHIILASTLRSSEWSLDFAFPTKILNIFLSSLMYTTIRSQLVRLYFISHCSVWHSVLPKR